MHINILVLFLANYICPMPQWIGTVTLVLMIFFLHCLRWWCAVETSMYIQTHTHIIHIPHTYKHTYIHIYKHTHVYTHMLFFKYFYKQVRKHVVWVTRVIISNLGQGEIYYDDRMTITYSYYVKLSFVHLNNILIKTFFTRPLGFSNRIWYNSLLGYETVVLIKWQCTTKQKVMSNYFLHGNNIKGQFHHE